MLNPKATIEPISHEVSASRAANDGRVRGSRRGRFPLSGCPLSGCPRRSFPRRSFPRRSFPRRSFLRCGFPHCGFPRRSLAWCVLLALSMVVGCNRDSVSVEQQAEAKEDPAQAMLSAIAVGNWSAADRYSKRVLIAHPEDPELITKVALVAAQQDRKREAAQLLVSAARAGNFRPKARVDYAVQGLIDVGEIYAAIELLEESLRAFPDEHQQRRILVGFLAEVQRTEKIPPHLEILIRNRILVQNRQFDFPLLFATMETSSRRMSEKTVKLMFERNPRDHRVKLAEAFLLLYRRDINGAGKVLEAILENHPDFAPAHAMYGRVLTAQSRWDALAAWWEAAPRDSQNYADHWLTLGDAAAHRGESAAALRGYWEASRRDPNKSLAWDGMAFAIRSLQRSDSPHRDEITDQQLALITEHSNHLQEYRERFNHFAAGEHTSQSEALEIARRLFQLGRTWEAEAWTVAARTLTEDTSDQVDELHEAIIERLREDPSWFYRGIPALAMDLSFLPMPEIGNPPDEQGRSNVVPAVASSSQLRLSEQSELWGLSGIGAGNNPDDPRIAPLIRSTGTGGGSIDYDLDGNPDLCMMNAGGNMLEADSKPNELLRNLGARFTRVTPWASIHDTRFGQGVAVADFNQDGFPDLFFANLGENRLFRNNGDGTFSDCTDLIDNNPVRSWSTSAAFVDINGDGLDDLFVTNYCQPVPSLNEPCDDDLGNPGPCHPLKFSADTDRVYEGTSEGGFRERTKDWIGTPLPGRGLGIVAGTLSNHQLGLFIANDMSRNAFYSWASEDKTQLIEAAAARGVAVDGMSRPQASMGIACGDLDRDGDLDLYVTGFGREYNVYYDQVASGLWKDDSVRLGLVDPTLSMVGFGTQAIDLDNDGIDELIVTNGNIGDFHDPETPSYDLPLQVFRRNAEGTFSLLDDDSWGPYFRVAHVGRALWKADVNRDGRSDVLITHMEEPLRLLVNASTDKNHRIGFRLVATRNSRDAVGAVIRFRCDNQARTLWMLAGDGYLCSNEKTLIAGLGQASEVTDVTVTWQDGSVDTFQRLPVDACYLIVQGQQAPFEMDRYEP